MTILRIAVCSQRQPSHSARTNPYAIAPAGDGLTAAPGHPARNKGCTCLEALSDAGVDLEGRRGWDQADIDADIELEVGPGTPRQREVGGIDVRHLRVGRPVRIELGVG